MSAVDEFEPMERAFEAGTPGQWQANGRTVFAWNGAAWIRIADFANAADAVFLVEAHKQAPVAIAELRGHRSAATTATMKFS